MNSTESGVESLPPTKLTIELSCRGTFLYLKLTGALTGSSAIALQTVTGQIGRSNLVTLDFGALKEIDAVGHEALVTLYRQARTTGARVRTVGVEGRVGQILTRFGWSLPPESMSCLHITGAPNEVPRSG